MAADRSSLTARNSIDLAERDARDRFLNIAATCPDAIICAQEDGRIIFWNHAAEAMFGHTAEVACRHRHDLFIPEYARAGYGEWLAAIKNRAPGAKLADHMEGELLRADGSTFPAEITYSSWNESSGFVICGIIRDITARREADEKLRDLACRDPLTRLPNRTAFLDHLASLIRANPAGKPAEPGCTLLLVGLDRFKEVNNVFGHDTGDRLLRQIAKRLGVFQRETVHVARLSGDEFTLLIPADHATSAEALAKNVRKAIRRPVRTQGQQLEIGASIGIALFPGNAETASDLLANADLAIRRAKGDGGNRTRFYIPALRDEALSRRQTEAELRRAFREHELKLFFQPQVSINDSKIVGAEALLRWRHPKHGVLSPASFLPVLETSTLATAVGNWVMESAVAQTAEWIAATGRPLRMGVNLFASQLYDGDLATFVLAVLDRHGLPPSCLEIEITENIAIRREGSVTSPLKQLIEAGVGIAFDDFGTGYGSLSYLKRVPVTRLKIDRSFVRNVIVDPGDAAIVRAVLSLGRSLGLGVIAEGIETESQRLVLKRFGCAEGQGYLFGKPMPAEEFSTLLEAQAQPAVEIDRPRLKSAG
jgi:diguanylate cyclase (GGDEF)-like protein/PAS domain S-box-containing protein